MKYILTGLRYALAVVCVLAVLLTLVSVVPSTEWWVQILGFLRLQTLVLLALVLLALGLVRWPAHRRLWLGLLLGSAVGLVIQAAFLWPYTPLAGTTVPAASPAQARDSASRVRILIVNVLIKNRHDKLARQLVQTERPDVLLAMETDDWWVRALHPLQPQYPYRVELPRADAYGMVLYSRLPLVDPQVQNLLQRGVPSIRTTLRLPGGRDVTFFGVHPTPPIPDNYPDGVGRRSIALLRVAQDVRQHARPAIVAGDFNDVPWSGTTRQLPANGSLHDVRRGRGLYNTFDANSHLARWPLDQFFVSPQWRLVELKRLSDVGSDHFPLLAEFVLSAE